MLVLEQIVTLLPFTQPRMVKVEQGVVFIVGASSPVVVAL
jgi:hypothetical protein